MPALVCGDVDDGVAEDQSGGFEVFLPAWYDIVWSGLALAYVALLAPALVLWFRARHDRGGGLVDVLIILFVPVIGPAAYLLGQQLATRGRPGVSTAESNSPHDVRV